MTVVENLIVETVIPFKQIINFRFLWELDDHAQLWVKGILSNTSDIDVNSKNFKNTLVKVIYKDEILFYGIIQKVFFRIEGGLCQAELLGCSASIKLDKEFCHEMFQKVSITYKQMLQDMVSQVTGNIIFTVGNQPINKPLLCYGETLWQYAKRMASHFHSHIIADVKTGKPNLWFGMRKGREVRDHELYYEQIILVKITPSDECRLSYLMRGSDDYQLGDRLWIKNDWYTIYKKEALLERGEVIFSYLTAMERTLDCEIYYQENITGLSLTGTVEKTENEQVYMKLDMDGKEAEYPFSWYPETGSGLYLMPEKGAKAELYFMGADEREVIAVRCRDTKKTVCDEKKLKLPDGARLCLNKTRLSLEKESRFILSENNITIDGAGEIEISAKGNVKISAKTVELNASDEIRCVTDQ